MQEVVVIPTCHRSEFLALTLERLAQAKNPPEDIRIYADTLANLDNVEYCRDEYYPTAQIYHAPKHTRADSGTWNILNSIKQGYLSGADLVYLLEEDIAIRPSFFNWHRAAHSYHDILASCGRREIRLYDRCGDIYTNPGACLSRRLIEQLAPHINDDYFLHPREYLLENFERWDEMSVLDDGLIRRVVKQMQGAVLTAEPGVCAHQGFRFYNLLDIYMNYETDIDKKIERLKQIISQIKPGDRYARDFEFLT